MAEAEARDQVGPPFQHPPNLPFLLDNNTGVFSDPSRRVRIAWATLVQGSFPGELCGCSCLADPTRVGVSRSTSTPPQAVFERKAACAARCPGHRPQTGMTLAWGLSDVECQPVNLRTSQPDLRRKRPAATSTTPAVRPPPLTPRALAGRRPPVYILYLSPRTSAFLDSRHLSLWAAIHASRATLSPVMFCSTRPA